MSTPEFEVHRALVVQSSTATGAVRVKIPALLGTDVSVDIPTTGLSRLVDGSWDVPVVGATPFVAVSVDRTKFFWLTGEFFANPDITVRSIQFQTDANVAVVEGQLAWNDDEGTIDIGMHRSNVVLQVGQEAVYYVKNQTGSTITNGTVVRFDGSLGASGRLKVAPFLADGTYRSAYLMGIATEDIPDGEDGYVTHFGKVRSLNTTQDSEGNTLVDGDLLYASATVPGGYTKIEPSAPNNRILLAAVVEAHAQQGTLFVRPAFPTSLLDNELVNAPSITDNDVLVYNGTTEVFENVPFDHGQLSGLSDDDHPQYLLADGSRSASSLTVTGSLTVDTNTIFVDPTNNEVGINTTSPSAVLDVVGTSEFNGTMLARDVRPISDTSYDLGASSLRWGYAYLDHPYFDIRRSTTLSVTSGAITQFGWNNTGTGSDADPYGMHTSGNAYITTPVAGVWTFSLCIVTDSTTTNFFRTIILATNNNPTANTRERLATAQTHKGSQSVLACSWTGYLPASSTVYTLVFQDSGSTQTWNVSNRIDVSVFSGALLHRR